MLSFRSFFSVVVALSFVTSACASSESDAPATIDSGVSTDGQPLLDSAPSTDAPPIDASDTGFDAAPVPTKWSSIDVPSGFSFDKVHGTGPTDAWAIASDSSHMGYVFHWDGAAWTQ